MLTGVTLFSLVMVGVLPNLGVNMFSDALALWFGLFVVDISLEKAREESRLPVHQAMVRDVQRLIQPIDQILMLATWCTAEPSDIPTLREAANRRRDVEEILARLDLNSPAPKAQLAIFTPGTVRWREVIFGGLSPKALRLEILIARYVATGDPQLVAAMQALETCLFLEAIRGRIVFSGKYVPAAYWGSLLQSYAGLRAALEPALAIHQDVGKGLGAGPYAELAANFIERGDLRPPVPDWARA